MEGNIGMSTNLKIRSILVSSFSTKHVESAIKHFEAAQRNFLKNDWEGVAVKAGKFVEAVTKALCTKCNMTIPTGRKFKAGVLLRDLQQLNASQYSDSLRILIPKSCLFIYEIANNRGGRHDSDEIDVNEMDSQVLISAISWVAAEMVRFSNPNYSDPNEAHNLIQAMITKKYPLFEEIDGKKYVNRDGASAFQIGLLLLYYSYPKRIAKADLIESIKRHGFKKGNAETAVYRLKKIVDDDAGRLILRVQGRKQADDLISKFETKNK